MPDTRRLLVCEGFEDVQFFRALINHRQLPDFRICDTSKPGERRGGISKIGAKLDSLRADPKTQFKLFTDILIAADCDDTPEENFLAVCQQIDEYFPNSSPDRVGVSTNGKPRFAIMMIPSPTDGGTMEKLCVDACFNADRMAGAETNNFLELMNCRTWESDKRYGKAWLRANISVRCEADPGVTLGDFFRYHSNLIDLSHPSLNHIAAEITRVGSLNGAARARPARTPAQTAPRSRRRQGRGQSA